MQQASEARKCSIPCNDPGFILVGIVASVGWNCKQLLQVVSTCRSLAFTGGWPAGLSHMHLFSFRLARPCRPWESFAAVSMYCTVLYCKTFFPVVLLCCHATDVLDKY